MTEPVTDNLAVSEETSSSFAASPLPAVGDLSSEQTLDHHSVLHSHERTEEKKRARSSHNMLVFDTTRSGGNPRKRRVRHLNRENARLFRPFILKKGTGDVIKMGSGVDDTPVVRHKTANSGQFVRRNQTWEIATRPNTVPRDVCASTVDSVVSDWLPPDSKHVRCSEMSDRVTRSTCATSRVASLEAADEAVRTSDCPTIAALGCDSLGAPQAGAEPSDTRKEDLPEEILEKAASGEKNGKNRQEGIAASSSGREKTSGLLFTIATPTEDPVKAVTPSLYDVYGGGDISDGNTGATQWAAGDSSKEDSTSVTSGCCTHNDRAQSHNSRSATDSHATAAKAVFIENNVAETNANGVPLIGANDTTTLDVDLRPLAQRTRATGTYERHRKHERKQLVISADESEQGDGKLRKRSWSGVHADTDAVWAQLQEQLCRRASDCQTDNEESNNDGQSSSSSVSLAHADTVLTDGPCIPTEEAEGGSLSLAPLFAEEEDQELPLPQLPSPASALGVGIATADEQASDSCTATGGKHERSRNPGSGGGGGGASASSAPFYSVSEGAMSKKVLLRSHRFYPVVRGVSRDNTKRRWAVYWKGNRKYFYDKFYEDCYQAYLHAVDFRKHAKAHGPLAGAGPTTGLIPGPGSPSFLLNSSGTFDRASGAVGAPSFVASCSSAMSTSSSATGSSLILSPAERLPRGSRELSAAPADALLRESTVDDMLATLNRHGVAPRCAEQSAIPSVDATTLGRVHGAAVTRRASGQTLELYKNAVRLMLQDLSSTVAPSFFVAANNHSPEDAEGGSREEAPRVKVGLQAVASLSLLQQVLQWHLEHVKKATHQQQVFQFLSILSPCLESTRLPSQSPPNLQQRLLLELLDLHVQQLLVLSKDIHAHFQKQQQQELLLLLQRFVTHRQQNRSPRRGGTHPEESPFSVTNEP
uniref:AP2 domain transcription factor AP2VIIa-8 n=1 Tax=Neospora caninum (strain Liverpool) TaxID=572307 RepID=A0A0F7UC09_NEOCL|nr:TPA: AP2 domain transcription factor AP2VIIa-8 [Neospora caninum Liverpool]